MRASSRPAPRAAAYLFAAALAMAIAHSVYQIPIQVGDSLEVIVASATSPSTVALLAKQGAAGTLRPMRYLQTRALVKAAAATGLSLHAWFRGTHAALTIALLLLFAAAAPVRSWFDLAPFGLALTVLTGMHTFTSMLREAYPVNHYLEVTAIVLFVIAMSQRAPGIIAQSLMVILLAFSLLLIETSVLVWVVIVTCALLRMPGVRPRTAVAATALMLLYAGVRVYLDLGAPQIGAHGSGFGATFYSGEELTARFATHPLPFFAYNVVAGILSVLFSEPQNGLYGTLYAAKVGEVPPVLPIQVISSTLVTIAIGAFAVAAARQRRMWELDSRIVLIAGVTLLITGALCLTYVKDEILSAAGVLYALSAFIASRWLLQAIGGPDARRVAAALVCLLAAIASPLWAFRAIGVHFDLRHTAFVTRNDWASVKAGTSGQPTGADAEWTKRVQQEALRRRVTGDSFLPPRGDRYWIQ